MKGKIVLILVGVVLIGIGGYMYATRPIAEPSQSDALEAMEKNDDDQSMKKGDSMEENGSAMGEETGGEMTFVIAEGTTASYELDETLRGDRVTVRGVTSAVTGQVLVNMKNIDAAEISPITINARTLKTDNSNRDNAVGRFILKSEEAENEFIVFTPTRVDAQADVLELGAQTQATISGDLTIGGVTKPATFTGILQWESEDTFTGNLATTVMYGDWDLSVPDLPFLADVDSNVKLTIDFSAKN